MNIYNANATEDIFLNIIIETGIKELILLHKPDKRNMQFF